MSRLLSPSVASTPVHIIIGSRSDLETARKMAFFLTSQDFSDFEVHVLSCHRNPDEARRFISEFAGKAIWAAGGMSFQLPAVLQSWLFHYGKHVLIWGISVGQTPELLNAAYSAMSVLPSPFLIHCKSAESSGLIAEAGGEILSFLNEGKYPEGDSPKDWAQRLRKFQERQPEFGINL